ncbi:MAG: GGDEF domain-containing protein [Armatimonadetes bacterium]|nr:GGDEF domain-containing protein [Armatimonadota bacterium]
MQELGHSDLDVTLQTLNYATRLLASELDRERLVERALDTLCDFGRARRAALLTLDEDRHTLEVAGELSHAGMVDPAHEIQVAGSPFEPLIAERLPAAYPGLPGSSLPLPAPARDGATYTCLCLPLVGAQNQVIGVATLERPPDQPLGDSEQQVLNVVVTLIAVALENARLFNLATVDGLTGLYVRRYFEIRIAEEIARIRRHGGCLALLMTDIDHFKGFNDTYGHQTGDYVLRELATLLRGMVRTGHDIACRYGGEEFVTVFPMTTLTGAHEVAERIRVRCEEKRLEFQGQTLQLTVSGGVAALSEEEMLTAEELVGRADAMLYEAKESGRNRVVVWPGG